MNLTDEQVDTIIEAHTDTVDGLKSEIDTLKKDGRDLAEVRKQLENAEKELETAKKDGWKDKHDAVKKEFDEYKASQTAKETAVAKEKAVRAYFEKQNITGQSLEIAMKGSKDEIAALELDENGGIKDDKALKELVQMLPRPSPILAVSLRARKKSWQLPTVPNAARLSRQTKVCLVKENENGRR